MSLRTVVAILCLSGALAARAEAQAALTLPEGARARFTAVSKGSESLIGTLAGGDDSSLMIVVAGRTMEVPRADVTNIELSRAPSHRGSNAQRGFFTGGLLGGIAGAAIGSDCSQDEILCLDRGSAMTAGMIVFAPLGALIGALTGGEHWQKIGAKDLRFTAKPVAVRGRGVGVQFSFAF